MSRSLPAVTTVHDRAPARERRICLLSEALSGVPDEGIKKSSLALAEALREQYQVLAVTTRGEQPMPGVELIPAPSTFLSLELRRRLIDHHPELTIYVPSASATLMAFWRARLLRAFLPATRLVMVSFQARRHSGWQQRLIRYLDPPLLAVQSTASQQYFEQLGCRVTWLPSGVDVDTFQPVDAERRRELRSAYRLSPDRPVVLHVGHLQRGRGIGILGTLAARQVAQVVLVTSSSTEQEQTMADELRSAGVHVYTDYQPNIEHFYQIADCYLFPVEQIGHSIEIPLSVLEALACNVPVVTTRFAGLPRLFNSQSHPGLVLVESSSALVEEALRLCQQPPTGMRQLALPYGWAGLAERLVEAAFAAD